MTFTTTLAASASYDVSPDTARILDLQITNNGPGTVYQGDIPPAIVSIPGTWTAVDTETFITAPNAAAAAAIQEGMAVYDYSVAVTDGTVVTSVQGARVNLSAANIGSDSGAATVEFRPPAVSASNGHPIEPGETVRRSAADMASRNQQGLRFVADGSGAVLTISKTRA